MASSKKSKKSEEANAEISKKEEKKKGKQKQGENAIEFVKWVKYSDEQVENSSGTRNPKIPDENKKKKEKKKDKEKKKKKKEKKAENGVVREAEALVVRWTSSGTEEEVEEVAPPPKSNGKSKSPKKRSREGRGKEDDDDEKDEVKTCRFPMSRVWRIIKSEDPDSQISQEAVLLINRATEMFIEQFCEDAYDCSIRDKKKFLHYKHLSSVVNDEKRFEFLGDFVPEKIKAGDALEQMKLGVTGP